MKCQHGGSLSTNESGSSEISKDCFHSRIGLKQAQAFHDDSEIQEILYLIKSRPYILISLETTLRVGLFMPRKQGFHS